MKTEYSEKEIKMIEDFGFKDSVEKDIWTPPGLYKMMVEKAFCEDMRGSYVDSLRRCYNALIHCTCYRMTKEWDDMIVEPVFIKVGVKKLK